MTTSESQSADSSIDPRAAMREYNAGTIDAVHLLRVLVSHQTWCIPGRQDGDDVAPLIAVAGDERWLQIFSDPSAYSDYLTQMGDSPDAEYLTMPGSAVFASLGNNLSGVNINPESDNSVHYGESQFEQLRRWGLAVEVERILAGHSAYTKPFHLLRAFDGYRLIFADDDSEGHRIAMVPDLEGRPLLAVFTADDAVREFISDARQILGDEPMVSQIDGVSLFSEIQNLPVAGMVFNCSGPGPAQAVEKDFAQIVLNHDIEN